MTQGQPPQCGTVPTPAGQIHRQMSERATGARPHPLSPAGASIQRGGGECATVADLAVFYEHPAWFEPLFAALDRRGVDWVPIHAADHVFDAAPAPPPAPVILNRIGMSAFLREPEHPIFYARTLFDHWEGQGARVINGAALDVDSSKTR